MARPGRVIADRFELGRLVASGGMGSVYRAHDLASHRDVALKLHRDEEHAAKARFQREAAILASLSHPAIARYVDAGQTEDGALWLAMEWLEGKPLSAIIRKGPLPIEDTILIGARTSAALTVAHRSGVVHRDIKPSNLFLVEGRPSGLKVIDFGVAKRRGSLGDITIPGQIVGTPRFMPPEQAQSEAEPDARSDIYALGGVLFSCLAGKSPFDGMDDIAILLKKMLQTPPRVVELRPDVPPLLDDLIAAMLSPTPSDRPESAKEVGEALAELSRSGARTAFSSRPPTLTNAARRVLSVVLGRPPYKAPSGPLDVTVVRGQQTARDRTVRRIIEKHGGNPSILADGSVLATLSADETAADLAARAAACALALRSVLPESSIAIATGMGDETADVAAGPVVDRATTALLSVEEEATDIDGPTIAHALPIALDDATASLLYDRFEVEESDAGARLIAPRDDPASPTLFLGRATPCFGRTREIDVLLSAAAEVREESVARAVVITGPPGVGKSRIRDELLLSLPPDAMLQLSARGDALGEQSPFSMMARALRRAAGLLSATPTPAQRDKWERFVATLGCGSREAFVSAFVGELMGLRFPDDACLELADARGDAGVFAGYAERAFLELLEALSRSRPVLVLLEDLQWTDALSVKMIDRALGELGSRPLLVVALARSDVWNLFPALWRERPLTEIRLGPISKKATAEFIEYALDRPADTALVEDLYHRSGGNAFYLEELLRGIASGREEPLPAAVVAATQARLLALDPNARKVLRAASVFGLSFSSESVLALLGQRNPAADRLDEWLDELVHQEIVAYQGVGRFEGDVAYAFRHALLRDAAYASLTDADRELGHRLAGRWLAKNKHPNPTAIAEHYELGNDPAKAASHYEGAAQLAADRCEYDAMQTAAKRILALELPDPTKGRAWLLVAQSARFRAKHGDADTAARRAASMLERGSEDWLQAVTEVIRASSRRGDADEQRAMASQLCDIEPVEAARGSCVVALCTAAVQMFRTASPKLAKRATERAEALAELGPLSPKACGWLERMRGYAGAHRGDTGLYATATKAAVDHFERAGDRRTACSLRISVGYAELSLGLYEQAEITLREALGTARQLELPTDVALAEHNLGLVVARLGRLDEGLELERSAVRLASAQRDRRVESAARAYLAILLLESGEAADARSEAKRAFDLATAGSKAFPQALMAVAALRDGDQDEAVALAEAAMDKLSDAAGADEGETTIRLALPICLHAAGQTPRALELAKKAKRELLARAARIENTTWRSSFLERIPENLRTVRGLITTDGTPGPRPGPS